ncbi:YesL family protein [Clostridium sp. HBUAS56017]|uniref:YesL family protein n=1 Tax=Clostridium sp. HBUAS56017 TaxID=2571128 RepID=UPI0011781F89|nr:YesL family protein [Clostridium sp. HBUAS56017]
MKNDRNILDSKLYIITNNITNFFITNLYFLLVISPLLIYMVIFQEKVSLRGMLLLSILLGPAVTTLFSVMGKLIRSGEISATKDFFHFYKLNFLQGLLIGIIVNIVIGIACFDMGYFNSNGNIYVGYLFLAIIIFTILVQFYIYPIISRYNIKISYAFKISLKLLVKKFYISISCLSAIIIILAIIKFTKLSLVGLLFGASVISYLIMKIEDKTISELQEEIKERYNSQ